MTDTYDVVVVGGGAGRGTLLRHLAPAGRRILRRERGDRLTPEPRTERMDVRQPEAELAHVA